MGYVLNTISAACLETAFGKNGLSQVKALCLLGPGAGGALNGWMDEGCIAPACFDWNSRLCVNIKLPLGTVKFN